MEISTSAGRIVIDSSQLHPAWTDLARQKPEPACKDHDKQNEWLTGIVPNTVILQSRQY